MVTSSMTRRRVRRNGLVCHRVRTARRNAASFAASSAVVNDCRSRASSRSATSISRSIVLLRRTSVGWAVSTGTTIAVAKKSRNRAGAIPASRAQASAWAMLPSRGAEVVKPWARVRRMWCWSSAILARCEKKPKARMICNALVGARLLSIVSRARRAPESSSRRKRTEFWRICSTVSKTAAPPCSRTVSPRMRPSSRISSRNGRSLSSGSLGCGFGMDTPLFDRHRRPMPLQEPCLTEAIAPDLLLRRQADTPGTDQAGIGRLEAPEGPARSGRLQMPKHWLSGAAEREVVVAVSPFEDRHAADDRLPCAGSRARTDAGPTPGSARKSR